MAETKLVQTHPAWEDWLGAGLGLLIVLTPSLVGDEASKAVQLNTVLIGFLVLLVAFLERIRLHHWEEVVEFVLGAWLIALPFIHGYAGAGALRYWHFALGGIVVLLALRELWQDWDASKEDLASHGW
jgi:SPW repeat